MTSLHKDSGSAEGDDRRRAVLRWVSRGLLALVPLGSLGLLCPVPSAVLAARRRGRADWVAFAGFTVLWVVWAGMEDASLATHGKVTYLQVAGPATVANAVPYANSLLQRHCDMVIGVGAPQAGAVAQVAQHAPKTRFVVMGDGDGAGATGR